MEMASEKVNGSDRDVSEKTWEEARRFRRTTFDRVAVFHHHHELVVVSRGDNIWWWWEFKASMELESRNIEEKRWSWFRGKGRDTDKKFDGGGRVEIDAVDGGEELVQR
ncbi:hypothetical protein DY000_02059266 [Brassica cretica]|uniref:Uncharacterized protein n=1 Tax=Brassica cretica TaxID=69181 RepID=A0ABQ7AXA1_BRACR|nr:hypothetical protein DY000_02059266 [Brassica cretica]